MTRTRALSTLLAASLYACGCGDAHRRGSAADAAAERGDAAGAAAPSSLRAGGGDRDCRSASPTSSSARIAETSEPGTPLTIRGRVLDAASRTPLGGIRVYAYHTDAQGHYSPQGPMQPRLCATLMTDASGRFRIETIKPGAYPVGGNPAHVHFELSGENVALQHREIFFEGDEFLTDEFVARELRTTSDRRDRSYPVRALTTDGSGRLECEADILVDTR